MNKSEQREVNKILAYGKHLGAEFMARSLSALHRAAMTGKSKAAILAIAVELGVTGNAEFII